MLVGRQNELAQLDALLAGAPSVLTVLGSPGVGKTAIASECARRWSAEAEVSFVSLSACATRTDLVEEVRQTLRLPAPGDATEGTTQVAAALAARGPIRVVLDNAEHIREAVAECVTEWSARCPDATFLVTSRIRLGVAGETVLELLPLSIAEETSGSEAASLFLQRAREAGVNDVGPEGQDVVEDIVQRLQGLPLAIEIAAAALRIMTLTELQASLAEHGTAPLDSASARSAGGLGAAIDWSWRIIGTEARAALPLLALFRTPFDRADAAHMLRSTPDSPEVLRALSALVDHSLLRSYRGQAAAARFSMLEPIRESALERLADDARVAAEDRYLERIAERARALISAHAKGPFAATVIPEQDRLGDYALACHRALDRTRTGRADGPGRERAVLLAVGVDRLVKPRGFVSTAAPLLEAALELEEDVPPALLAATIDAHVQLSILRGSHGPIGELCERARRIAESSEDPLAKAFSLYVQYLGAVVRNDFAGADDLLTEAFHLFEEHGQPGLSARVMCSRALTRLSTGDLTSARLDLERCLRLAQQNDDPWIRLIGLEYGVYLALEAGLVEDARRGIEEMEAIPAARLLAAQRIHVAMFALLWSRRALREALVVAERATAQAAREGLLSGEIRWLASQALCLAHLGRPADARTRAMEAFERAEARGDEPLQQRVIAWVAFYRARAGEAEVARELLARSGEPRSRWAHHLLELARIQCDLSDARARTEAQRADEARKLLDATRSSLEDLRASALSQVTRGFGSPRLLLGAASALLIQDQGELEGKVGGPLPENVPSDSLVVGHGGAWFLLPGQERVNVKRPIHRRLLEVLAGGRAKQPAEPLTSEQLIRAIWPGDDPSGQKCRNRLNNAISTLRSLGLGDAIARQGTGYVLAPDLPVVDLGRQDRVPS